MSEPEEQLKKKKKMPGWHEGGRGRELGLQVNQEIIVQRRFHEGFHFMTLQVNVVKMADLSWHGGPSEGLWNSWRNPFIHSCGYEL